MGAPMSDQTCIVNSLDECSASVKCNGPRTAEGKQRIAQAQLKHGAFSRAGLEAKHSESIKLRQLEDAMYLLGMIKGPKTRGAKPANYQPINSLAGFKKLFANT